MCCFGGYYIPKLFPLPQVKSIREDRLKKPCHSVSNSIPLETDEILEKGTMLFLKEGPTYTWQY